MTKMETYLKQKKKHLFNGNRPYEHSYLLENTFLKYNVLEMLVIHISFLLKKIFFIKYGKVKWPAVFAI